MENEMTVEDYINKYYVGKMTLFDGAADSFNVIKRCFTNEMIIEREDWFLKTLPVLGDYERRRKYHDIFLTKVVTFSEITRYGNLPFSEMADFEYKEAIKRVLEKIKEFSAKHSVAHPIGYEIKNCSLIVCWNVIPFLKFFDLDEISMHDMWILNKNR